MGTVEELRILTYTGVLAEKKSRIALSQSIASFLVINMVSVHRFFLMFATETKIKL